MVVDDDAFHIVPVVHANAVEPYLLVEVALVELHGLALHHSFILSSRHYLFHD